MAPGTPGEAPTDGYTQRDIGTKTQVEGSLLRRPSAAARALGPDRGAAPGRLYPGREVPALLDGALAHVRERLDAEALLLDAIAERRFGLPDRARLDAANKLIEILRELGFPDPAGSLPPQRQHSDPERPGHTSTVTSHIRDIMPV